MTTVSTTPTAAGTDEERARLWLVAFQEACALRGLLPWPGDLRCAGGPSSGS